MSNWTAQTGSYSLRSYALIQLLMFHCKHLLAAPLEFMLVRRTGPSHYAEKKYYELIGLTQAIYQHLGSCLLWHRFLFFDRKCKLPSHQPRQIPTNYTRRMTSVFMSVCARSPGGPCSQLRMEDDCQHLPLQDRVWSQSMQQDIETSCFRKDF